MIECDHETEGFCMFEGSCEYRFYIKQTNQWVCKEFCRNWLESNTSFTEEELDNIMLKE